MRIEDVLHRTLDHVYFPMSNKLVVCVVITQRHRMIQTQIEDKQKYHTCRFNGKSR